MAANDIVGYLSQGVHVPDTSRGSSKSFSGTKFSGRAAMDAHLKARAGVAAHHADVPGKGGGHGGNPNHDEQGRFT